MQISFGATTDAGRRRQENEDSLLVDFDPGAYPERPGLFVVCDGVGGAVAGKTASTLAVNRMGGAFHESPAADVSERLIEAAELASAVIFDHSLAHPATEGMATTLVAAAVDGSSCHVVNVGDSRAYQISDSRISRLTTDHTLVQEQVTSGAITPEQAAVSPYRHIITRSLGRERSGVGAQTYPPVPLRAGDVFVLCSDGLTDMVSEPEILAIAGSQEPKRAAAALVNLANGNGGHDNITVIVIRVDGDRAS
jgi:protein phosphatase